MADKQKYRVAGAGIYGADGKELPVGSIFMAASIDPLMAKRVELVEKEKPAPDPDVLSIKKGVGNQEGKFWVVNQNGKHLAPLSADQVVEIEKMDEAGQTAELTKVVEAATAQ